MIRWLRWRLWNLGIQLCNATDSGWCWRLHPHWLIQGYTFSEEEWGAMGWTEP